MNIKRIFYIGTLNSTEDIIACLQPREAEFGRKMADDCLTLNVWTPFPRTDNTSVMVRFKFYLINLISEYGFDISL